MTCTRDGLAQCIELWQGACSCCIAVGIAWWGSNNRRRGQRRCGRMLAFGLVSTLGAQG